MSALPLPVALPLAALCLAIIWSDLKMMRIPDWISVGLVGLFAFWVMLDFGAFAIVPRLVMAGVIFCICFGLFAARLMGGGDTKVIPALALFAAPAHLSAILLLFSACLLSSIVVILAARRWLSAPVGHRGALHSQKLPMGVAIGATGLIAIGVALTRGA